MNQLDPATPEPNPYQPPTDPMPGLVSYALPALHWPLTIGLFLILFVVAFPTFGLTMPFALSILFGGIRTALIFNGCRKAACLPPSYVGSAILSPILCFIFLFAACVAFFFICAARFSLDNPTISEQAWLSMTGVLAVAVFAILYAASIKISIATHVGRSTPQP